MRASGRSTGRGVRFWCRSGCPRLPRTEIPAMGLRGRAFSWTLRGSDTASFRRGIIARHAFPILFVRLFETRHELALLEQHDEVESAKPLERLPRSNPL